MSDKVKALREQHNAIVVEARKILEGEISPEKEAEFDKRMADADALTKRIEREEKLAAEEARTNSKILETAERVNKTEGEVRDAQVSYREAFNKYLRFGHEGCTPEQRSVLMGRATEIDNGELRAQSVSGGSPVGIYGGYIVEDEFAKELERAMLAFGGVQEVARELTTGTGATLTFPLGDDTGNVGAILGENQPITETDTTFSQFTIGSYLYTSNLIRVSWQLMQDSAFDISGYVNEIAAERLGRILNTHFTTGDGSSKPTGVVNGSTAGVTGAGTTGITYNDLVDLEHSVPRAYRTPAARFMFNDNTLKVLRKLKDADGRPIWQPSLQAGVASNLNGRAYTINDDMADIDTSAKSVLFGDFRHYLVRKVKGFTLVRLNERYADRLQTGFFIYARYDGKLKDAGKGPIRHLVHPAASP